MPTTWEQFAAQCKQMKKDGLISIAFGDKDAWPALGTFDQINVRTNGYHFHMSLMKGVASRANAKMRAVFDHWAGILPARPIWRTSASTPSPRSTLVRPGHGGGPTDGFMLSKKPKNNAGAVKSMEFLGTPEVEENHLERAPCVITVSTKAGTSSYSTLQ